MMAGTNTCPSCGIEVGDGVCVCPACGVDIKVTTASFQPLGEEGGSAEGLALEGSDGPLLVVRKGPEIGERFYLDRPSITIGRDPAADIFLNDITVSRQHATLQAVGAEVSIADAGSLNGTYVNGVSVDRAVLCNGDAVQIGRFQMIFLAGGGE
jgi:pSer/pThr/pTyr-binding forkhead associated (FHA) protein